MLHPKKVVNELNDESHMPVFQDEAHFQVQTTITRKWAEKGSKPKVISKIMSNYKNYVVFIMHNLHLLRKA